MKDKLEFLKRPWLLTREAFEVLAGYDLDKCEQSPVLGTIKLAEFEEKLEDLNGGVAVLRIDGPLMPSPSLLARFFMGAVDTHRVAALIRAAQNSTLVSALVLEINSPGGAVTGTMEAGEAVRACVDAGTPVYAFSRGTVASAAYWIASGATELVGTPSSRWGNVGAIRPHIDMSEAHRAAGMKIELFASGAHKGAGAMGTSLTDEQRRAIQDEIQDLGERFKAHVLQTRTIAAEDLEGLAYYAGDAVDRGFIDAVVLNFEDFVERIGGGDAPAPAFGRSIAGAPGSRAQTLATLEGRLAKMELSSAELLKAVTKPAAAAPSADLNKRAAREAARIAAEAGVLGWDLPDTQAAGGEFANLSEDQKWAKYREILDTRGRDLAHDFYLENLQEPGSPIPLSISKWRD